jgi:hypothetical protein
MIQVGSSKMKAEDDLLFLREVAKDLSEYILAKDVYWPLQTLTPTQSGEKLPQLTLGSLALSQTRLSASPLPVQQAGEYARLCEQIEQVHQEWRSNWRVKEEQEIGARLKQWQEYIRDLRGEPRQQAAFYAREARTRAILALLQPGIIAQTEQLNMLDQILRGLSRPGPFLWEAGYTSAFPQDRFWFLYIVITAQKPG